MYLRLITRLTYPNLKFSRILFSSNKLSPYTLRSFSYLPNHIQSYHRPPSINYMKIIPQIPIYPLAKINIFDSYCREGKLVAAMTTYSPDMNLEKIFVQCCKDNQFIIAQWLKLKHHMPDAILYKAFYKSCLQGHIEIAQWLYPNINKSDLNYVFIQSCIHGQFKIVKWLLTLKDFESRDLAFRQACKHGRTDIVKLLLQHYKLDIHMANDYALKICKKRSYYDLAEVLLDKNN